MFSFQNPAGLLLILLIPLFYILRKFKILNQTVIYAVLGDWEGKYFEWHGSLRKFFSAIIKLMIGAGFILSVIAFADPVISIQEKVYTSLGNDIIFVVDTSPSMAAKDIDGNTRIDAARNTITTLVQNYEGFRYGIVALGSNASVLVPPTAVSSAFTKKLGEIQVGMMGNGSAIGDGLSTAVCHLASSKAPKKCIILLTDGENNAGEIHPQTAAKLAADNNITLYIVGIGTKGRISIEYTDYNTGKLYSGYLESDFDSNQLKKIAELGQGRYFEVQTVDELARSLSSVVKNEAVSQSFTYKTTSTSYYQKLILIAMILFAVAAFTKRFILQEYIPFKLKPSLILRSILQALAFIMLCIAQTGISWGTYLAPVQKNSTAVSMVFDISNSMLACDEPDRKSRLQASTLYAKKLLSRMDGTSVSVVLAKGDGITAIPLTEDFAMVDSLLDVMSPSLMTAPGSSLGKGVLAAKDSFPQNFSSAGRIWIFTDGEETDGSLQNAISECTKYGIPVSIIGFGTEDEVQILAGDGKTIVYTALRTENMEKILDAIHEKSKSYKNKTPVIFSKASDLGTASKLLSQLSKSSENTQIVSYEARPVPRYKFFLILASILLSASFFAAEFDLKNIGHKKLTVALMVLGLFTTMFTGCEHNNHNSENSDRIETVSKNKNFGTGESTKILFGSYEWHKKNYRKAVALFLSVVENADEERQQTLDYSLYDLATAYSMSGEEAAALDRYSQISADAPQIVRYNAYYNAGIIAHNQGNFDSASEYFRKALEIDNTRLDAKINLELSIQMTEAQSRQNESEILPTHEEKEHNQDLENTVFQHIKENDKKQWKNSDTNQAQNLSEDY